MTQGRLTRRVSDNVSLSLPLSLCFTECVILTDDWFNPYTIEDDAMAFKRCLAFQRLYLWFYYSRCELTIVYFIGYIVAFWLYNFISATYVLVCLCLYELTLVVVSRCFTTSSK